MFGFQRVGDAIWAAADQRARGFLLGATPAAPHWASEGLQHQGRHQPPVAATIPNCRRLRPGHAGEMTIIGTLACARW